MKRDSAIREAAELGAKKMLEYFQAPKEERDSEAATIGVKAGRNYASIYAAETNRLHIALATAKHIGTKTEDVLPLLEEIAERPLDVAANRERNRAAELPAQ